MDDKKRKEIEEVIQSSHINFLFGAGVSHPFLPLLGDIETRLSGDKNEDERRNIKKEYFEKVMSPNIEVVNKNADILKQAKYKTTHEAYKNFFEDIGLTLLHRKNTILSKQANVFTTNIDILMENALEEIGIEYNDGFSGRLDATFSLSNLKKSILKRSLHFENISEIPVFNLIKIHGSLTWEKIGDKVYFSKLKHFTNSLKDKTGNDFDEGYQKLAIVNPEKKKFEETVIDLTYYELLRMYSSELEKENTVLFIVGCSMEDEHIREITIRSADSNPTLKIYLFCHELDIVSKMNEKMKIGKLRYSNIEIIEPEGGEKEDKLDLAKFTELIFGSIVKSVAHDDKD
jgi:NAD-dependent SIR2 family protein deacetylase